MEDSKLIEKQKLLINLLKETIKKDDEIIALYKEINEGQEREIKRLEQKESIITLN